MVGWALNIDGLPRQILQRCFATAIAKRAWDARASRKQWGRNVGDTDQVGNENNMSGEQWHKPYK